MCTTSAPKPKPVDTSKTTPVYMHNAFLDNLGINSEARGRNSLRIDLGSPVPGPSMGGGGGASFPGGSIPPWLGIGNNGGNGGGAPNSGALGILGARLA